MGSGATNPSQFDRVCLFSGLRSLGIGEISGFRVSPILKHVSACHVGSGAMNMSHNMSVGSGGDSPGNQSTSAMLASIIINQVPG